MTNAEVNMIIGLKSLGLDKQTTVGIVSMLDSPMKMRQMENFLIENWDRKPTEQEILHKLEEIVR